jgi:exopolysaccharide biosynthesis polyprenyl glycosylphosphotransferase
MGAAPELIEETTQASRPFLGEISDAADKTTGLSQSRSSATRDWIPSLFFLFLDVFSWVVLYGLVSFIRRDAFFVSPFEFVLVDCVAVAVILQALYVIGGYSRNTEMRSLTYTTEHILAVLGATAISSLIIYSAATFDQSMKPSRGVLLLSFIVFLPVSISYRRFVRKRIAAQTAQRAFLVIGGGELAARFYQAYRQSPNQQRLEFVDNDAARVGARIAGEGSPLIEGGIAGKLSQLDRRYSGVILAESVDRLTPELLERLVRTQFQRTRVYTLESFYEAHWRHVPMHTIDPFWPLQMGFQLARLSPYHYLKRLFDIVVSGFLLVVLSPLFVLLEIMVWIDNGRPGIFRQDRVGREGQHFLVYKFRTMRHRPSSEDEDIYTRQSDPRVTRVGRWLRKLRLDELPQLWNVFKGDMSLIGPRAEWIKCAERYEKKIPFYHFRHLVKPGITGWAQVNYPYGESNEDAIEKLQYDLYYIRHYSLKLDAMIVLKTIHTMLFGKGR